MLEGPYMAEQVPAVSNVLALLSNDPPPAPPAFHELHDGLIDAAG